MDIGIELQSSTPNNLIKTVVYDAENNDLILERYDYVSGSVKRILKLPLTSRKIIVESFTKANGRQPLGKDQTFKLLRPQILPLRKASVTMTEGDREFMKWISQMVKELPRLTADGKLRRSSSGRFKIVIQDKLRTRDGVYINSPAMVGKKSGTIEISKDYMMKMSQNQRIAVLTHEYGHFFKNPLMNLPIGDEFGADLNGVTLFAGSGFGLDEYGNAFKKVFDGADTEQNNRREKVIKMFLDKLENGQYFNPPYKKENYVRG
jgi:hypothetical protein